MELFGIMQIEAVILNRNCVDVCVCVCLLLFTGEYELVRPVLWLCEDEDFYLNPACLHYNASEKTAAAVWETHHCPVNGDAACVDKRAAE